LFAPAVGLEAAAVPAHPSWLPGHRRPFCTSASSATMTESDFHHVADATLDGLVDLLAALEEDDALDADINLSVRCVHACVRIAVARSTVCIKRLRHLLFF